MFKNIIGLQIYLYCRSENKEFIKACLSEESKRRRRRQYSVNIRMTTISWALEFTCGLLAIGYLTFYHSHQSESYDSIVFIGLLLDQFINFVLIPGSLVLNNDVNKDIVVDHGWCQGLRNAFVSSKVSPVPGNPQEHPVVHNPIPRPIPTISGNLEMLSLIHI